MDNNNNFIVSSPAELSEAKRSQYEADKIKLSELLKLSSPDRIKKNELLEVNARLNDYEYSNGLTELYSYPKNIVIGTYCKCNAKCVFCLGSDPNSSTPEFSLTLFKDFYEKRARNALATASRMDFCGFGEPLTMKGIMEFVDYLNDNFPCSIKSFTTNGIGLNRKLVDAFIDGLYTLHVSLHASRSDLHKQITKTSTFNSIIKNLEYANRRRIKTGSKMYILLVFVVNTLNVRDIPEFVKLALKLGVDQVRFEYMTIYTKEQIQYSCFFDKELTNEMFKAAKSIASGKIDLRIPPLFNSEEVTSLSTAKQVCKDPWDWVYMDTEGVNYCCLASQHMGNLKNNTFEEIWNTEQYQNLRRSRVNNSFNKLCGHCMKGQTFKVNDFRSHVTARDETFKQIMEEYESIRQ
jgi:MoaA/NifB/PqqE/SkfB family radical SAM enzyme